MAEKFGDLYTERNVMLSGTHTHSAPGGFLMHLIFDLNTMGFVPETFDALVSGMVLVSTKIYLFLKFTTSNLIGVVSSDSLII